MRCKADCAVLHRLSSRLICGLHVQLSCTALDATVTYEEVSFGRAICDELEDVQSPACSYRAGRTLALLWSNNVHFETRQGS